MSNLKSRKFHELPRKWFHFKPLTPRPTHPGGSVLGDTGREGGRRKVGVRELEGRKVGGGGGREEGGRRRGSGRIKVGVRELEGRKLGGGRKGGWRYRGCRRE